MFTTIHTTHDDFWGTCAIHPHHVNDDEFDKHLQYLQRRNRFYKREENIYILAICVEEIITNVFYTLDDERVEKKSLHKTPIAVAEILEKDGKYGKYGKWTLSYISVRNDHKRQGFSKKIGQEIIKFCQQHNISSIKRTTASQDGEKYSKDMLSKLFNENNIQFYH